MRGYWLILGTEISNDAAQSEYVKLWKPIAEKYQARVNPLTVPPVLKESRDAHRVIVVEFPSYDAAKACHDDPAYRIAREYALKASNRELLIIKGELE